MRCLLLPVFLLASFTSAQVISVGGGGAALANAVATAPAGAVIVVAGATTYDGFTVSGKELTIIGVPVPIPWFPSIIAPPAVSGDVWLQGAGAKLSLRSFLVVADPSNGIAGEIRGTGVYHLEDVAAAGMSVGGFASPAIVVARDCSIRGAVVVGNCVAVDSSFVGEVDGAFGETGLVVTGSLRAERIVATGATGANGSGNGLQVAGEATLVDCSLHGGVDPSGNSMWDLYGGSPTTSVTIWNTPVATINIGVTTRRLVSAEFVVEQWVPGGVSQVVVEELPQAVLAVVATTTLSPWSSLVALEQLWIGATPDLFLVTAGVADASGRLFASFTLPAAPAIQHLDAWLAGVAIVPIPMRTSVPIGGKVK